MEYLKLIFKTIPISIFIGICKSIHLLLINIKYAFSIKGCEEYILKSELHLLEFKNFKYLFYPCWLIAALIATIITIPINLFLCSRDYIKEESRIYEK